MSRNAALVRPVRLFARSASVTASIPFGAGSSGSGRQQRRQRRLGVRPVRPNLQRSAQSFDRARLVSEHRVGDACRQEQVRVPRLRAERRRVVLRRATKVAVPLLKKTQLKMRRAMKGIGFERPAKPLAGVDDRPLPEPRHAHVESRRRRIWSQLQGRTELAFGAGKVACLGHHHRDIVVQRCIAGIAPQHGLASLDFLGQHLRCTLRINACRSTA